MKNQSVLELPEVSAGCFALTYEQAKQFFTDEEIEKGESRLEVKSFGPWQIPLTARGLVVDYDYDLSKLVQLKQALRVYGKRVMFNWSQTGFEAEGKASIDGKKRRVFTSSKLFQFPDGKLMNASVLHIGQDRVK